MRRRLLIVIGALAFAGVAVASGAHAETEDTTPTTKAPTTTSPPMTVGPTSTAPTTSTTAKKPTGSSTTTTVAGSAKPVPPPASGASQPLDPSLLGGVGPVDFNPSTTTTLGGLFGTDDNFTTSTVDFTIDDNSTNVANTSDGPSGVMLGLAAVAWLATLGGLLIYAEDQRAKHWRHLAR